MDLGQSVAKVRVVLMAHERLFLALIAGAILWLSIGRVDTLIANHDKAKLQQAQSVAEIQQAQNQKLAEQVAQQLAQYQALSDKVQAQNAALEQENVTLAAALTKQQKVDAGLPLPELANRWLTFVPQAKLTATPTGIAVDPAGAVATVQQLEQVPVQQQELSAAQVEVKNDAEVIAAANMSISTLNLRVDGLNAQLVDNDKVCTDKIAVVKAEGRKSKRRWFYAGVVVGWLGRSVVKAYTGF